MKIDLTSREPTSSLGNDIDLSRAGVNTQAAKRSFPRPDGVTSRTDAAATSLIKRGTWHSVFYLRRAELGRAEAAYRDFPPFPGSFFNFDRTRQTTQKNYQKTLRASCQLQGQRSLQLSLSGTIATPQIQGAIVTAFRNVMQVIELSRITRLAGDPLQAKPRRNRLDRLSG